MILISHYHLKVHWLVYFYICVETVSTLYLPRQKWIMNKTLIFSKLPTLAFNILIPVSFSLVKAHFKLLFWYNIELHHHIAFNVLHVLKSYPWYNFLILETRKSWIEPSLKGDKLKINFKGTFWIAFFDITQDCVNGWPSILTRLRSVQIFCAS